MKLEIEIKLRLSGKLAKIRRTLGKLGFRVSKPRALESNILFDNSKRSLRKHGMIVRVRLVSGHRVLTYKGPSKTGRYKKRQEIEFLEGKLKNPDFTKKAPPQVVERERARLLQAQQAAERIRGLLGETAELG